MVELERMLAAKKRGAPLRWHCLIGECGFEAQFITDIEDHLHEEHRYTRREIRKSGNEIHVPIRPMSEAQENLRSL